MALKAVLRRMTLLDRAIVLLVLGIVIASFLLIGRQPQGERVVVEQGGAIIYTAPLNVDRRVSLDGPLGETVLVISGGHACIETSPCPHKVCVGMGEVARAGEILACVPNRLLVMVEGEDAEGKEYDLLSR